MKVRITLSIIFLLLTINSFSQSFYLLAGTYTRTGSKGIYVYKFNAVTGEARWISNTDSVINPSFLTAKDNYVYAVNETRGTIPGRVSSFLFNKKTGELHLLNTQLTGGGNPCHLALSPDGKWLSVANYWGGNLSIFPINKDGFLQPLSQLIQHSGSSINKKRQEQAHVHETVFSSDTNYLFAPDLGMDKVMIYKFNPLAETPVSPSSPSYISTTAGGGPRHIIFSGDNRFAYLITELSGTVTVYRYNNGKLTEIQTVPCSPKSFNGIIGGSEISISPNGKFLYTSQRGEENLISIFKINMVTGKLKLKGYQSTFGKTPRSFVIDPTGKYLLVANQDSNNIVIFKRNRKTGLLKKTRNEIQIPIPVALLLVPNR